MRGPVQTKPKMLSEMVCYIEALEGEDRRRAAHILGLFRRREISEDDAERRLRTVLDEIGNALLSIYLDLS